MPACVSVLWAHGDTADGSIYAHGSVDARVGCTMCRSASIPVLAAPVDVATVSETQRQLLDDPSTVVCTHVRLRGACGASVGPCSRVVSASETLSLSETLIYTVLDAR
jgi:hypothetical protein